MFRNFDDRRRRDASDGLNDSRTGFRDLDWALSARECEIVGVLGFDGCDPLTVMSGPGILFLFLFPLLLSHKRCLWALLYCLSADLSAFLLFERCLVRCIALG